MVFIFLSFRVTFQISAHKDKEAAAAAVVLVVSIEEETRVASTKVDSTKVAVDLTKVVVASTKAAVDLINSTKTPHHQHQK